MTRDDLEDLIWGFKRGECDLDTVMAAVDDYVQEQCT